MVALPVLDHALLKQQGTPLSRDAQSPLGRVSECSESDSSPQTVKLIKPRAFQTMRTLDLIDRLDEREKEVQELLLAGEVAMQRNSALLLSPASSSLVEESPLGLQWEADQLPDFADMLDMVVRDHDSLQAKRACTEDTACSPIKRARSSGSDENFSEDARGLVSMLAGVTQRLARLSDPQYLDDLLALQTANSQPKDPANKQTDQLSEIELLRKENCKLKESLAESQREKAEMSKVLHILEDRLAKSNEYLKDAFQSEKAMQPKCILSCGNGMLSSQIAAAA